MAKLTLVCGSKNSSSWSLRPWLAMKQAGIPFDEVVVQLYRPETAEQIARYSPSGRLPVLIVDRVPVWDSLAICEFLAEHVRTLWPQDSEARAQARSIACELHSGFSDLRTFMPMDFIARFSPPGRLLKGVERDIQRIQAIWRACRARYITEGAFLFGNFTIVDAMFAPVASRLTTYAVPLEPVCSDYVRTLMELPAMQEWGAAAAQEVAADTTLTLPVTSTTGAGQQAGRETEAPPSAPEPAKPSLPWEPMLRPAAADFGPPRAVASGASQGGAAALRPPSAPAPTLPARPAGQPAVKPIGGGIHRRR